MLQKKSFFYPTILVAFVLLSAGISATGELRSSARSDDLRELSYQEGSFTLTRVADNARQYSLVVSDSDEHSNSGIFTVDQLQFLRAIMTEAEKFALSSEAVGTKDPITTRFADKAEKAFIVDVEKLGNQSTLFLTVKTEIGRVTVNAGRVVRSTRREEGFFFDLLTRLESILPKLPAPPK